MAKAKPKATGYDKYVNWKLFFIPVVLFFAILILPTPYGMKDVGTEIQVGPTAVVNLITTELFNKKSSDSSQWELLTAQIMERNMRMGALSKDRFLKRDLKWCKRYKIQADAANLKRSHAFIKENISDKAFVDLLNKSVELRKEGLKYEDLTGKERKAADKGAWQIKVAVAMMVFVVFCFMTECIPLPGVAFCIGLILVFTGVVTRKYVAMLYWSDACWFIMGSLMFAAAFVKTGVDKRMCLMMFKKLAVPNIKWVTLIFFIIIAPLAAFISDHALAAMFLPIGMLLYQNSLTDEVPEDKELAKMLMIAIAMACNIGGPGAPSGGARNVIMMTYLNDMFGFDIGYFQWVTYCFPFILVMIPVTWVVVNWRFKPRIYHYGVRVVYGKGLLQYGHLSRSSRYRRNSHRGRRRLSPRRGGELEGLPGKGRLGRGLALCRRHYIRSHIGRHRGSLLVGKISDRRPCPTWNGFGDTSHGHIKRSYGRADQSHGRRTRCRGSRSHRPQHGRSCPSGIHLPAIHGHGHRYSLILCLLPDHRDPPECHCLCERIP